MSKPLLDIPGMRREINAESQAIVEESVPLAKAHAPRRTGRLKGSVKARVFKGTRTGLFQANLEAKAFPGLFQERGTKRHGPKAFLDPAFPKDEAVVARIANAIERGI